MDRSKSLFQLQSKFPPRLSDNEIRRFIETRIKYEPFFDNNCYRTSQPIWEKISIEAEIPEHWRKLRKKWSNLKYTYKQIFFRSKETGIPPNWPFFDIFRHYENEVQAKTENKKLPTLRIVDSYEESNSADYFMETNNYVIEEPAVENRTNHRIIGSQNTKSTELNQPLLRIDQSIFKPKADINSDPNPDELVLNIEDESETEVYEIIHQDYSSDSAEHDIYDHVDDVIRSRPLSRQSDTYVTYFEETCLTAKPHENESNNEIPGKYSNKSKKQKLKSDDDETGPQKKMRREILKCTNVFLKYMKIKYDIDPNPSSSESGSN